jgi:hypothetical protein
MSVYRYIAEMNPTEVNNLCIESGFADEMDTNVLAYNLENLVAYRGESALKKIFNMHPDKDAILELFQKKDDIEVKSNNGFVNAEGEKSPTSKFAQSTNTYILLGSLIISVAIIASIK